MVQVPGIRASAGFEPVALCARTRERLDPAAERLGISDTSTDWESFVARDDLDVISVATPARMHADMALAAFEAGKAVLCEKPLAADLPTGRLMAAAAAKSAQPSACCFENRWNPDWLAVGDTVRSGSLGKVYVARVNRSASYWHPSRRPQARWMYDRDQGGGYLAGLLVHDLDFLVSMLGRPVSVCAEVRSSEPVRTLPDGEVLQVTADDTSALLLRLESGAIAILSVSVIGLYADHYRLELFGSEGTVIGDGTLRSSSFTSGSTGDTSLTPLPDSDRAPAHPGTLPDGLAGHAARAMALMLDDWLPAFDGGVGTAPSFDDGLLSLAIIDAANRSAAGAGWVDIEM
ncbi:oxidoreductase [Nocardia jinanensis]|uniref:Oxidoreductase n=2 Tax=Nocardia jinanensis TaxID=382504 RepID=A0A917VSJ8_9NOCA|nr:oxidoreductase [Nocardia jinanensis]